MSRKSWCIEIGSTSFGEQPKQWRTIPLHSSVPDTWRNYEACETVAAAVRKNHECDFVRIRRTDKSQPATVYYPINQPYYASPLDD